MVKFKWSLIGFVVAGIAASSSWLVLDWKQLREENARLTGYALRATDLADRLRTDSMGCITSLQVCQTTSTSDEAKAKLALAARVQTIQVIRNATDGDKEAQKFLGDLGWAWTGETIKKARAERARLKQVVAGVSKRTETDDKLDGIGGE